MSIKVLHTADLHFSNKADKLAEVVTTSEFLLERARVDRPDVAIVPGDVVDEHDGPILIDSVAARAAIHWITELAEICPVVVVRGTRSHDKETPYLFGKLRTKHPIYVGTQIEMVALAASGRFIPVDEDTLYLAEDAKAVFTLLPSPDKVNLISGGLTSMLAGNMAARETMHDVLCYLGELNDQITAGIPRILGAHGMITGSKYSSGITATGEDFEYTVADLNLTNTDLKAFGHVHIQQSFPGNIFYSGSIGRLDMGETEEKGFLYHTLEGNDLVETRNIPTPARKFVLFESLWGDSGVDAIFADADRCEAMCAGSEVRFRYSIPEECRHMVNRRELIQRFTDAGALMVKVEQAIIHTERQRAAGISRKSTIPEKIEMLGETNCQTIPRRVIDLAATIEGRDVQELLADARAHIARRLRIVRGMEDAPATDFGIAEAAVIDTNAAVGAGTDSLSDLAGPGVTPLVDENPESAPVLHSLDEEPCSIPTAAGQEGLSESHETVDKAKPRTRKAKRYEHPPISPAIVATPAIAADKYEEPVQRSLFG